MSILTDRCRIKIFYRGRELEGNSEKCSSVVVGITKRSVLKQLKKGEGGRGKGEGGREWVVGKGKILHWREGRYNNHCNNRIVLSFVRDIF